MYAKKKKIIKKILVYNFCYTDDSRKCLNYHQTIIIVYFIRCHKIILF